jgi:ABC-type lipoprotein release transport system permease subunit
LAGLLLCAAVLAASFPLLLGVETNFGRVLYGEGVNAITPVGSGAPLNLTFASSIAGQPWAEVVSPEVFAFASFRGEPLVARGVLPQEFLELEGADLSEGLLTGGDFALAGERLAGRLGLSPGSEGVLTGSERPSLAVVEVTGVFRTAGPAADELMIPLPLARKMASLGADELSAIRVRTSDREAMLDFLEATGLALSVSNAAGTVHVGVEPDGGLDGRLTALVFLHPELWTELGRSYVGAFAEQGLNGVRVVILAFLILLGTLGVAGIFAVVWRATAEASRSLGILRVLGARRRTLTALLLREFAATGSVAIVAGVLIGHLVAAATGGFGAFLLFSHTVQPSFDPLVSVAIFAISLASVCVACLVTSASLSRKPPRDLIAMTEQRRAELREEVLTL